MRQILILACAVVFAGGYAARYADRLATARSTEQVAAVQPAEQPSAPPTFGRSLMLDSDRHGHFPAEARVDGRPIKFIVDTGASLVTLRESDAAEVGIWPTPSDYKATVATANGSVKAARAKLSRVEIGGITVYDVPALVLPDEALGQSLLGVSFLSRLKRYEYANGRMVLEQ